MAPRAVPTHDAVSPRGGVGACGAGGGAPQPGSDAPLRSDLSERLAHSPATDVVRGADRVTQVAGRRGACRRWSRARVVRTPFGVRRVFRSRSLHLARARLPVEVLPAHEVRGDRAVQRGHAHRPPRHGGKLVLVRHAGAVETFGDIQRFGFCRHPRPGGRRGRRRRRGIERRGHLPRLTVYLTRLVSNLAAHHRAVAPPRVVRSSQEALAKSAADSVETTLGWSCRVCYRETHRAVDTLLLAARAPCVRVTAPRRWGEAERARAIRGSRLRYGFHRASFFPAPARAAAQPIPAAPARRDVLFIGQDERRGRAVGRAQLWWVSPLGTPRPAPSGRLTP